MLLLKIPNSLQIEWEVHSKATAEVPAVGELLKFLSFRADILVSSTATQATKPAESNSHPVDRCLSSSRNHPRAVIHANTPRPQPTWNHGYRYECSLCPGLKHPLYHCDIFNGMTVHQRGDHMRTRKLCFNCLTPGHNSTDCRSPSKCRACGG